jgi:hypothetical protein
MSGIAHVYWFAPSRDGDVFRVRQRLCEDCLAANVTALLTPPDAEELTCSACGISVDEDVFPIYLTWYVKREGAVRGAMALCEEHQLEIKVRAGKDALQLPDRAIETPDLGVAEIASHAAAVYSALGRRDPGIKHPHVVSPLNTQGLPKAENHGS